MALEAPVNIESPAMDDEGASGEIVTGYLKDIDKIREEEYPMLNGQQLPSSILKQIMLTLRQIQPTSIMPVPPSIPSL